MDGIEGLAGVADSAARLNQQPYARTAGADTPGGPPAPAAGSAAVIAGLASHGVSAVSASGDFIAGEHTISVTRSGNDLVVSLDGGAGVVVGGFPVTLRGSKGTLTITMNEAPAPAPSKARDAKSDAGGGTLKALARLGVSVAGRTGAVSPSA